MMVFTWTQPGTRLVAHQLDADAAFTLRNLIAFLGDCLTDASLALHLYGVAISDDNARTDRIGAGVGGGVKFRADLIASGEPVVQGVYELDEVPEFFVSRAIFMHARSFVYALDLFLNAMNGLLRMNCLTPDQTRLIKTLLDMLEEQVPGIKGVRDSAHHSDERAAGQAHGKQIPAVPIKNHIIDAAGGAIIQEALDNNRYGRTLADGTYGEVAVQWETLTFFRAAMQATVDAFEWRRIGPDDSPPEQFPTR